MKLTKSNIENIRNHAQRQGIKVTSDQIRAAVTECYPEASDDTEFDTQMIPSVVEILLAQQPPQPLDIPKTESNIVLSDGEKQDLVAGAAREAGLNLVASEIKSIATNIASGFADREELLNAVMGAIVAYAEQRIDAQSAALKGASERIRRKVNEGNGNARDAFASINEALEATNNDFKSELEGVAALFSTAL
ncbi:hypothetical protein [Nostoc sp.]|uniref:hypothetical protein n=1 Tax=Nostoc sp. TaxID=1180 RepID=UPI002FF2E090